METLTALRTQIPTYIIDGSEAHTWPDIVAGINAFIPDSAWQGSSLDALDDILYGGYGTPEKFVVVWRDSDASRRTLGLEATQVFYKNAPNFQQLYEAGHVKTLFETLVEIFKGHENIELRLE